MPDISIFAKRAFLNVNPTEAFADRKKPLKPGVGHLLRVSSMIRGDQIAEWLGAKLNPTEGYENDICIYVKPGIDKDFKFAGKPYLDIIDGHTYIPLLKEHPEVSVIACSAVDRDTLSRQLTNKVVLIPQHHCNFERDRRIRIGINTIGIIGVTKAFTFLPEGLKDGLAKRKIELLEFSRFFTRQDVVDFYKKIDLQLVWRPYSRPLSNPLKITHAASFGIPTVAFDEDCFGEVSGCYFPVHSLGELLLEVDSLRDNMPKYKECAKFCLTKAEEYHIDNIGKKYRELL